jgi:hypothetical protein
LLLCFDYIPVGMRERKRETYCFSFSWQNDLYYYPTVYYLFYTHLICYRALLHSFFFYFFPYKVIICISMSSENQCFFSNKEFFSDTFISFHELRHECFTSVGFPAARSRIDIMLLRSVLFYQPVLCLRRIYVCS